LKKCEPCLWQSNCFLWLGEILGLNGTHPCIASMSILCLCQRMFKICNVESEINEHSEKSYFVIAFIILLYFQVVSNVFSTKRWSMSLSYHLGDCPRWPMLFSKPDFLWMRKPIAVLIFFIRAIFHYFENWKIFVVMHIA